MCLDQSLIVRLNRKTSCWGTMDWFHGATMGSLETAKKAENVHLTYIVISHTGVNSRKCFPVTLQQQTGAIWKTIHRSLQPEPSTQPPAGAWTNQLWTIRSTLMLLMVEEPELKSHGYQGDVSETHGWEKIASFRSLRARCHLHTDTYIQVNDVPYEGRQTTAYGSTPT